MPTSSPDPIYHLIATANPLGDCLTYRHHTALAAGTRVAVRLRGRLQAGVVWASDVATDLAENKILAIETVFAEEAAFSEEWRALLAFAARYYHYPLGNAVMAALPPALRQGKPFAVPEPQRRYGLNEAGRQQPAPAARFSRQLRLWTALAQAGRLSGSLNQEERRLLARWSEAGWIATQVEEQAPPAQMRQHLNPEQQAAADAVGAAVAARQFAPFLLYGITGSGKTEVYLETLRLALAQGGQALLLVPEINLTPQLLARIERYFPGLTAAVLHSQSADGARSRDFVRAQTGQASLVVGTRLAVFTPLPRLRLIVVDEEHDTSYKQDNDMRYHARDLALWRAQQARCPVLLSSATPSLESWQHARSGRYRLLSLTRRAKPQARLPQIVVEDVRQKSLSEGLGAQARQLLAQNLLQGGLSLIYLNRRGFAPALFCSACGYSFGCPHCSSKLVLHRQQRQLRCHHCDFKTTVPKACPSCGNQDLTALGMGTQRVEEVLRQWFPEARIRRVDRDSMSRQTDWQVLYEAVERREVDMLVGTQMLAKGHDFARLNLVVVVNADNSLFSADIRAPEHLFAELMQVSGRAGRAGHPGKVLVQTLWPQHEVFQAFTAQDYPTFADTELAARRRFKMPPTVFAAAVRADAPQLQDALAFLREGKEAAHNFACAHCPGVEMFGPVPLGMVRLAGRERAQILLESADRKSLHRLLSEWQRWMQANQRRFRQLRFHVDVDPLDY